MLGCVGGEDARDTGVEATAEDSRQPCFLEALLIGPLPAVLKLRFVQRLIVRRVEVVDTGLQAGIHDMEILVG